MRTSSVEKWEGCGVGRAVPARCVERHSPGRGAKRANNLAARHHCASTDTRENGADAGPVSYNQPERPNRTPLPTQEVRLMPSITFASSAPNLGGR